MKKGVVYLIGAGPGDPGLITLKGKEILESCDALVYEVLGGTGALGLRYTALILFVVMMVLTNLPGLKKLHPVLFIALGAVCGLVFQM